MATITYQQSKTTGTALNFVAASAGGDQVATSDRGLFLVKNGGASAVTVTVATPGNTKYGAAIPDISVSVAAGATTAVGPLPSDLANSSGVADITYSAVTSVTVAAVAI